MSDVITELEEQRAVFLWRYDSYSDLFGTVIEQYNTYDNLPGYGRYGAAGNVDGFLTSCKISAPVYSTNYLDLSGASAPIDATRNSAYSTRELTFSVLIDLIPLRVSAACVGNNSNYDSWSPSGLIERLLNVNRNTFMRPNKWALRIPNLDAFYYGRCTNIDIGEVIGNQRAVILSFTWTVEPYWYDPIQSIQYTIPSSTISGTWTNTLVPWARVVDVHTYNQKNTALPMVRVISPYRDLQMIVKFYRDSSLNNYEEVTGYVFGGETIDFVGSIPAPYGYGYVMEVLSESEVSDTIQIQGFLRGV